MSSEQEQVAASAVASSVAREPGADAPNRRRIVVAQKPTEKPIALISRDEGSAEQFEALLGRARAVVVFPSLTHFCSDSSRTDWAGVVIARACAWDQRLLGFVPSTHRIAFFRVAEEGYGWPSSVSHLDSQDDIAQWLQEIAKPLPFQLKAEKKGAVERTKREGTRRNKPKVQLKFELATPRGTVVEQSQETQAKSKSAPRAEQLSLAVDAGARASARPAAPGARATAAKVERAKRNTPAQPPARRGRPPAISSATLFGDAPISTAKSKTSDGTFVKLAAELGLARANELLQALRTHAHGAR